jgi:hypothetical protein
MKIFWSYRMPTRGFWECNRDGLLPLERKTEFPVSARANMFPLTCSDLPGIMVPYPLRKNLHWLDLLKVLVEVVIPVTHSLPTKIPLYITALKLKKEAGNIA